MLVDIGISNLTISSTEMKLYSTISYAMFAKVSANLLTEILTTTIRHIPILIRLRMPYDL